MMASSGESNSRGSPTLDTWLQRQRHIINLVRKAFQAPGSVKRDELLKALRDFDEIDHETLGDHGNHARER